MQTRCAPTMVSSRTNEEWSEQFSAEVRRIMSLMVSFDREMADAIAGMLVDPIKYEEQIRKILVPYGVSIHMSSPRGENRDKDVVGTGRDVAWQCGDSEQLHDHCTACGRCESIAGDGHVPWYDESQPPCEPKPRYRRDVQEE